jgi:hypothetical protein
VADQRTPEELPEEAKEKYRRWWSSRSPEERARLRALNGQPVTTHEFVFLTDSDGLPFAAGPGEAGDSPVPFHLPNFLLHEEGEAEPLS